MCANFQICCARSYITDHDTLQRLQAFACVYKPLNMFPKGTGERVGYFFEGLSNYIRTILLCADRFKELLFASKEIRYYFENAH